MSAWAVWHNWWGVSTHLFPLFSALLIYQQRLESPIITDSLNWIINLRRLHYPRYNLTMCHKAISPPPPPPFSSISIKWIQKTFAWSSHILVIIPYTHSHRQTRYFSRKNKSFQLTWHLAWPLCPINDYNICIAEDNIDKRFWCLRLLLFSNSCQYLHH